ncbi:unnamed protein product [Caretta caretta]
MRRSPAAWVCCADNCSQAPLAWSARVSPPGSSAALHGHSMRVSRVDELEPKPSIQIAQSTAPEPRSGSRGQARHLRPRCAKPQAQGCWRPGDAKAAAPRSALRSAESCGKSEAIFLRDDDDGEAPSKTPGSATVMPPPALPLMAYCWFCLPGFRACLPSSEHK